MELIGELQRLFASSLYPLRVPLAILALVTIGGLAALAWHRGWIAAARRHAARTTVVALAAIVLLAPPVWYLGSPLVIRTELVEPPVAVDDPGEDAGAPAGDAPTSTPASSGGASPTVAPGTAEPDATATPRPLPTPSPVPTPSPTPTPLALSGEFSGADDFHFGRGTATLREVSPGRYVVRFEDFSVRNGPDLFVYLSPDRRGWTRTAIELGRLRATDGSFNTSVPRGTDVSRVRSVVIWCREFAVLFAVAPLKG